MSISLTRSTPTATAADQLRKALGDPLLDVIYRHVATGTWIDPHGVRVEQRVLDSGRRVTPLERDGDWVAALIHDPALLETPQRIRTACDEIVATLDHESLLAQLRAQLLDERASRARILAASDRQRSRFERNLHDGAQQRLVGLALTLQLAGRQAEGGPVAELLVESVGQIEAAIADLRELARGMHPAIVTDLGLAAAVATLAERPGIPIEMMIDLRTRLPDSVEVGAYYMIAESLANANKHSGATAITVSAQVSGDVLDLSVVDNGQGGAASSSTPMISGAGPTRGLLGLDDRIAALGGRLDIVSDAGRGTTVRAQIPLRGPATTLHPLVDDILLRVVPGDDAAGRSAARAAGWARPAAGDADRRRRALKWMIWQTHAAPGEIIDAQPEAEDLLYAKAYLLFLGGNRRISPELRNWVIGYLTACGYSENVLEAATAYDDSDTIEAIMSLPRMAITAKVIVYDALRTFAMANYAFAPTDFDPVLRAADTVGVPRDVVADLHEIVIEEARLRHRRHEIVVASAMPKLLHDSILAAELTRQEPESTQ